MRRNCADKVVAIIAIGLALIQGACATSHPLSSGETIITSKPLNFQEFMACLLSFMPIHYGAFWGGYFEGELVGIPAELQRDLNEAFPSYSLKIVKVRSIAMEVPEVNLLVLLDAETNEVVSYCWAHWLVGDMPALEFLLRSKSIAALEDAKAYSLILAKLVAILAGEELGDANVRFEEADPSRQEPYDKRVIIEIELKSKLPPDVLMVVEFDIDYGYHPWKIQFKSKK